MDSFVADIRFAERPFSVSGMETAERVAGALVSAETFDVLGIHPVLGRGFAAEDDRIGAPPVVLLSDALWTRRYAADRRIIGQTIRVNGVVHTVIGVTPPQFKFPKFAELWVPLAPNAAGTTRAQRDYGVVARLKPDVTISIADAEMVVLAKGLEAQYEPRASHWPYQMYSLTIAVFAAFAVLLAAIGLYGVIAHNTTMRTREIGVRIALGAEGEHVIRLVAREGGRLVTVGIVLGIGGSVVLLRAVRAMMFGASPIDLPMFAAVSALLAAVAFGAIWSPARRAAKISPLEALRAE